MKRIVALELRRDRMIWVGVLLASLFLSALRDIFYDVYVVNKVTLLLLYMMLPVFVLIFPISISTGYDKMKKRDEYFLVLPIKRWEIIAGKMIYCLCLWFLLSLIIVLLPDPDPESKFKIYSLLSDEISGFVCLYIFIGVILLLSLMALLQHYANYYRNQQNQKGNIKIVLITWIVMLLPFVVIFLIGSEISRYRLFILPIFAGLAITVIGITIIISCCYKWEKRKLVKLFFLFAISTVLIFASQFSYSYIHLKSIDKKERISAFKMFLYPMERKGFSIYTDVFNSGYDNNVLFGMSRSLLEDSEKSRGLIKLWESGIDNKDPFKRALSITFLSMNGENENLYNHIFTRMKEDTDFRNTLTPYEWSERLVLLAPPSKLQEMTLDLLKPDNHKLRYIGYYCARYFPSNAYIPPILESMKKEKREVGIEVATKTLSVIMLDDNKYQSVSVADVPKTIEGYEKWYAENESKSFDDRLSEMLQRTGHSSLISKMTNEELFSIYNKEIREKGSDHFLTIILENILLYRLKLVGYFNFVDKFTGKYYWQSAHKMIKEKIQQNKPFPYRYISD